MAVGIHESVLTQGMNIWGAHVCVCEDEYV